MVDRFSLTKSIAPPESVILPVASVNVPSILAWSATDKSPLTDVVGAVIAMVPSVALDIVSPFASVTMPSDISNPPVPATIAPPAIVVVDDAGSELPAIVKCVSSYVPLVELSDVIVKFPFYDFTS